MIPEEEFRKHASKVIAKAWADDSYKQQLMADPAKKLKEEGVEVPRNIQLRIVEDSENLRHVVLPPKPSSRELSAEEIAEVVGGLNRPPRVSICVCVLC